MHQGEHIVEWVVDMYVHTNNYFAYLAISKNKYLK